jgi:oxalate decarboxylase/phosphoglucose isomerase-like protein (cupin superfamily)
MSAIDPNKIATQTFDGGLIKWLVTPDNAEGAGVTLGEVVMQPGIGQDRHYHPESEEILYVLSREGEQMLDDGEPFQGKAGDIIYVPNAVFHSTINTGWKPIRVLPLYNPAGPEKALEELPDFREVPPGKLPQWERA